VIEAVRTSTSTFGIWAIIVVAVVLLGIWLVGISVADNIQTRESRRWKQLRTPEAGPAGGGEGVPEVPGQRRGDEHNRGSATLEAIGQGLRSVLNHNLDPGPGSGGGGPGGGGREGARGHEAATEPEPPTRPDLPPQPATGQPATPTQRTGDADRAERLRARRDDDPGPT
jgi:hypothetical protein